MSFEYKSSRAAKFVLQLLRSDPPASFMYGLTTFTWLLSQSALQPSMHLRMLMSSRNNANAALVFEFCYRLNSICRSYFGKVDEEAVKNNFVLIYELIDGA
jgi:hypothetical protein